MQLCAACIRIRICVYAFLCVFMGACMAYTKYCCQTTGSDESMYCVWGILRVVCMYVSMCVFTYAAVDVWCVVCGV